MEGNDNLVTTRKRGAEEVDAESREGVGDAADLVSKRPALMGMVHASASEVESEGCGQAGGAAEEAPSITAAPTPACADVGAPSCLAAPAPDSAAAAIPPSVEGVAEGAAAVALPTPALPAGSIAERDAMILRDRPATKAKLEWLYSTGRIRAAEITDGVLQLLAAVSDSQGVGIVQQFGEVPDVKWSEIRNKAGFLMGIIKRLAPAAVGAGAAAIAAPPGFPPGGLAPPQPATNGAAGGGLSPKVEAKLEELYGSGRLERTDLDARCLDELKMLSETSGLEVIAKFCEADLSTIKSKGGFFMGIIKRVKEQERGVFAGINAAAITGMRALGGCPGGGLWPAAQAKVDALVAAGRLQADELDARCMEQLRSLPEYLAVEVMTKFGEADLRSVYDTHTHTHTHTHARTRTHTHTTHTYIQNDQEQGRLLHGHHQALQGAGGGGGPGPDDADVRGAVDDGASAA